MRGRDRASQHQRPIQRVEHGARARAGDPSRGCGVVDGETVLESGRVEGEVSGGGGDPILSVGKVPKSDVFAGRPVPEVGGENVGGAVRVMENDLVVVGVWIGGEPGDRHRKRRDGPIGGRRNHHHGRDPVDDDRRGIGFPFSEGRVIGIEGEGVGAVGGWILIGVQSVPGFGVNHSGREYLVADQLDPASRIRERSGLPAAARS